MGRIWHLMYQGINLLSGHQDQSHPQEAYQGKASGSLATVQWRNFNSTDVVSKSFDVSPLRNPHNALHSWMFKWNLAPGTAAPLPMAVSTRAASKLIPCLGGQYRACFTLREILQRLAVLLLQMQLFWLWQVLDTSQSNWLIICWPRMFNSVFRSHWSLNTGCPEYPGLVVLH